MITNIPTFKEFEELGIECISKAFEMLYAIGDRYTELSEDLQLENEVTHEDYWQYNNITVRTSLIVLFQGVEYLMKMEVAKESAFLLIDSNRTDWPTLPQNKNKNYDELHTISGENLLSVFCAVVEDKSKLSDFVSKFENLRLKRNRLVHSTGIKNLEHEYVINQTLYFLSSFYKKDKWISLFRQMFISEPTFGFWEYEVEEADFYRILNFVEKTLTKGELNKYLPFDIKSRRYLCPNCTYWLNKHCHDEIMPRWSFLKPNAPDSKVIECLICAKEYNIDRTNCKMKDCKGNVVCSQGRNLNQCLTCFN